MPKTEEEIRHVMGMYERNGHPGWVHVIWDKCHSGMQALCMGKVKSSNLSFSGCMFPHQDGTICIFLVFYTYNDKTISKYDPVMQELKEDPYKNIEWIVLAKDENGEIVKTNKKAHVLQSREKYSLPKK